MASNGKQHYQRHSLNEALGLAYSYHQALSGWFRLPDGSVHQGGTCSRAVLRRLIAATLSDYTPEAVAREMEILDIDEELGRWHLINMLAEESRKWRLYATKQEAEQAERQQKPAKKEKKERQRCSA